MSLIIATFLLTILGTFLTRSGVISSVHAFGDGPIGIYFLAFIAVTLVFSMVLLTGRSAELRSVGHLDNMASRETVFLLNNLLLTAFTFTVLLGTLFPILAEAARGVKVSVGAPFFNRMTIPLCVALVLLVGIGPMLPWRVASMQELKRKLIGPVAAAVLTLAVALTVGMRDVWGLLAFTFAAFSLVSNVQEFVLGTSARRRAGGGSWPAALWGLMNANPKRYGGYTAHIGLIMMVVGITGSSVFRMEREATVRVGEVVQLQEYGVRLQELWAQDEPHRFVVGARFAVLVNGQERGEMNPRLNYYRARGSEPITTPAVRSRAHKDLYMNLLAFAQDGSTATVTVITEPLVVWIWIGSAVIAFGAFFSVWPRRRRRTAVTPRREQRYEEVAAA
jgi:cytochrome c-type biogenesis protein CcmF